MNFNRLKEYVKYSNCIVLFNFNYNYKIFLKNRKTYLLISLLIRNKFLNVFKKLCFLQKSLYLLGNKNKKPLLNSTQSKIIETKNTVTNGCDMTDITVN